MESLITQINTLFQNNQVLSTVAGGSVVVWLVTNIKMIWAKFIGAITALISFEIVNIYEDARGGGEWSITAEQAVFNKFISETKAVWERTKHLDLSSKNFDAFTKGDAELTYGFSVRIVMGKLAMCSRNIERNQKITVTTTLRIFFANKKKFMKRLSEYISGQVSEDRKAADERDYISVFNGEAMYGRKYKRKMESIFTNDNEHYRLLNAIKDFQNNKEKYRNLSYPYSFSALLYGPPGCGKSSSILAVASALNMDISYINLSKTSVSQLLDRINNARCDGCRTNIIVFEDIDALTTSVSSNRTKKGNGNKSARTDLDGSSIPAARKNEDSRESPILDALSTFGDAMSLSDLLNITDGLLATDGTVCIFITNHIEKLDAALLRAGRMNEIIEFGNINSCTAARMLKANLGWEVEPEDLKDVINPAELQTAILQVELGRATRNEIEEKFFN